MTRRHTALLLCSVFAAIAGVSARADMPVPENAQKQWSSTIREFFRRPSIAGAALSPNGKLIAAIAPGTEGRGMLVAMDVQKRAPWPVIGFSDLDITGLVWINDHRVVVYAEDLKNRLPPRPVITIGRPERPGRASPYYGFWYAVDTDGSHQVELPLGGALAGSYGDGNDVLVMTWEFLRPDSHRLNVDAYRLDTMLNWAAKRATGSQVLPHQPTSLVSGVSRLATFIEFDDHLQARAATVVSEDEKQESIWYRPADGGSWTTLADFDVRHPQFWPAGAGADDQGLYVVAPENEDTLSLFSYDVKARHLGDKVFGLKGYDVNGFIRSGRSQRIVGVEAFADKRIVAWMDRDFDLAQKSVDAALPDTTNELTRGEDPASPFLVFSYSDVQPGRYYLFDPKARKLEEAFNTRPWIDPAKMSAMRPVRYPARDGLTLRSYLTLPKGRGDRNLPLVVLVRDGPHTRNHWGYEAEVQFLASLGYAVLQPNFRGSQGYGLKFLKAGWRGWGLAMQDDITDGVEYLAAQGTIDRHRVCIMGTGYGGYAALMGLAREPERFRCGVDRAGWTDLGRLFHGDRFTFLFPFGHQWGLHELVGDPETMREQFTKTSPMNLADRIKAPVLMVYGEDDLTPPIEDGSSMRDALERNHVPTQWITMGYEGHQFRMEESRYRYYDAVEQFLRKYNPPD